MKSFCSLPYHCFLKFTGTSRIPSLFQIVLAFSVDGLLAFALLGVRLLSLVAIFFDGFVVLLDVSVLLGVVVLDVGVLLSSPSLRFMA